MAEYCTHDAYLVRKIAVNFFKSVYIQGYKQEINGTVGYCFPKKMVYYSAAEMSWHIWNTCFLVEDIEICENAVGVEKKSYRGGLVNVFEGRSMLTCILDINSSFPAAMTN